MTFKTLLLTMLLAVSACSIPKEKADELYQAGRASCPRAEVCFSPRGGCEEMIVKFIDSAGKSDKIHMLAYNFSSNAVGAALANAAKRGVEVNIIVDNVASHQKGVQIPIVKKAGAKVWIDAAHKIAHNKVIIIGNAVQTGSFNYSGNAESSNGENALILRGDTALTKEYLADWELHREHAKPYVATKTVVKAARAAPSAAQPSMLDELERLELEE